MVEEGAPEVVASTDYTLYAPAATPRAILDRLQKEISEVVNSPEMVRILADQAATPGGASVADTDLQVKKDFQFWQKVVADVGLKAE
jgi:tripartite-type tricarboxylate transporter receptor subunit TctC